MKPGSERASDLESLLEQLHERHRLFYHAAILFSALGIFGLLCLLGVL